MTKFFPLSQLPPRKFELGDRVENAYAEGIDDPNYCFEGTVIGYHYEHPLWLSDDNSRPGWIYTVLKTHDSNYFSVPFITHFHEDEITLVEGFETTFVHLSERMKARLFGFVQPLCSLLQRCNMRIEGTTEKVEIHIQCGDNDTLAADIWRQQSVLRAVLKAWNLPESVVIFHGGQSIRLLQSSFQISPTIKIPVITTMQDNNNDIIIRAQRHQHLLQAIQHGAVATTLHDANEESGFTYLDVLVDHPERLNLPNKQILGQPATIVDPAISEPRIHHIKKALANGQCETYQYQYDDKNNGVIWRFDVSVTPIPGSEEVITIVKDSDPWQRYYWLNRLN